jgi:hypothetical protein
VQSRSNREIRPTAHTSNPIVDNTRHREKRKERPAPAGHQPRAAPISDHPRREPGQATLPPSRGGRRSTSRPRDARKGREREVPGGTRSTPMARRVGGEAPMPAFRPVVSSPPPAEPDVRLPPHPALHEHNSRLLARAARAGFGVLAAVRQRCADIHRRPPPIRSCRGAHLDPFALRTAFPPSPVGRYCHDYYGSSATPRRQRRTVRLPHTLAGSAGTAGALPTFTHTPVGRVGAQLYPGGIAARHRNAARGLAARDRRAAGDGPQRVRGPSAPTAQSRQFRGR